MQGARLAITSGSRRYANDELRFTGIDIGVGRSRNKYAYQHSDDGNDSTEVDSQATTDNDTEDEARAEMEDALVQSALARIRKARSKGKQDVKLNKGELAALERRRKRLQSEAESAARKKGKDRRQRKEKEKRVAVPLSHLDPSLSNRGSRSISDDTLTHLSHGQEHSGPPIGMFAPPSTSQTRTRSSTPSSHHSSTQHHSSSSPFDYQYVSATSNRRHASDTARPSSSLKNTPHDEDWRSQSPPSHLVPDPFQYQTEGPPGPYPSSAMAYSNISHAEVLATARSGSGEILPEG
ncbi:hypothetical protein F5X98DRAFT_236790 [Xylaria grammica]|nr:hypothetical protein F5X98DRAFT_236790 [Xylaria grammica]